MRISESLATTFAVASISGFAEQFLWHNIRTNKGAELYQRVHQLPKMKANKKAEFTSECCKENQLCASSPSHSCRVNTDLLKVASSPPPLLVDKDTNKVILFMDQIDKLNAILEENVQLAVWHKSSLPKFIKVGA